MTTIVLNTATGAVTEYDWAFDSMSPQRAASEDGLFTLGGDDDAGEPITGEYRTGTPGGGKVQNLGYAFVAGTAAADGVLIVQGRTQSWEYPVIHRPSGIARAKPGRGIRESYLGFGYRNTAGAAFRIDQIDIEVNESRTRRN